MSQILNNIIVPKLSFHFKLCLSFFAVNVFNTLTAEQQSSNSAQETKITTALTEKPFFEIPNCVFLLLLAVINVDLAKDT